jgi:uncharacterized membrane protein SpoIIM required for sporulation
VDIDRFIALNQPAWNRLEELCATARRSPRRLSGEELDELVALYQRTSAHLAQARAGFDDVALVARLSRLVGGARGTIYRTRSRPGRAVSRFFVDTFPAAVWQTRRAIAVAAVLFLAPAVGIGVWLANSPDVRSVAIPEDLQQAIASHDFEDYYSSQAAASFQTEVTTNNVQVSFLAFASGVLLGVPTAWVLVQNGANVGEMAAVMHSHHEGSLFWGLVLPHGLLEITSVLVAGGAGLMLAWALIAPGDRSRTAALADEGLRTVTIVVGLVLCFVVAGFTEAWVTPSGLPTWTRVGIGVALEALFVAYVVGFGRNAAHRGLTGRLREEPTVEPPPPTYSRPVDLISR